MRVLLDTCVLVPNPIRLILLQAAESNLFFPLWSDKIFAEWEFFVSKNNSALIESTRVEILLLKSKWENSLVPCDIKLEKELFLPDKNDRHVLSCAILGDAQLLVTNNLKDFPGRVLAKFGIIPRSVDSFLLELYYGSPQEISLIVDRVFNIIKENGHKGYSKKSFLKKFGLSRLAKVLVP